MPLEQDPKPATNIAVFDGQAAGAAAKLNYDVEMPGHQRGRRFIELRDIGLDEVDWKIPTRKGIADAVDFGEADGNITFNAEKAVDYWFTMAGANNVPGDKLDELRRWVTSPEQAARIAAAQRTPAGVHFFEGTHVAEEAGRIERIRVAEDFGIRPMLRYGGLVGVTPDPMGPDIPELGPALEQFLKGIGRGIFYIPRPDGVGGTVVDPVPVQPKPQPRLVIIEIYAVSSFLGDYGLGRTVKTMTLAPGEELKLRTRTWRSSKESVKESSSVFDSATVEARSRFQSSVQNETTDKSTRSQKEEWHVDAKVEAGWGWGSAEVSGGGSGEYHSGREQFARSVNDATHEHANESSNKRDVTVTSSTEREYTQEEEDVVERVIRNVNLRRALNLVFRELNQTYDTYVHLVDVKIGYTDGRAGSWREVPLSGLRRLLTGVLTNKVDETAQRVLDLISIVFDYNDRPQSVLQSMTWDGATNMWKVEEAKRDGTGKYSPPSPGLVYRYRRGEEIGNDNDKVEGVIMGMDTVVLRTDSIIMEALLGQADALDPYAMMSQYADARAKELGNNRTELVNTALDGIADEKERVAALADLMRSGEPVRIELTQPGP